MCCETEAFSQPKYAKAQQLSVLSKRLPTFSMDSSPEEAAKSHKYGFHCFCAYYLTIHTLPCSAEHLYVLFCLLMAVPTDSIEYDVNFSLDCLLPTFISV